MLIGILEPMGARCAHTEKLGAGARLVLLLSVSSSSLVCGTVGARGGGVPKPGIPEPDDGKLQVLFLS